MLKTVTIDVQVGALTAGTAGSTYFDITTEGIADATTGTIAWFSDVAGTT